MSLKLKFEYETGMTSIKLLTLDHVNEFYNGYQVLFNFLNMKKILTLITAIVCLGTSKAQVSFSGQYRARGEVRNGFKKPIFEGQEPAAFIEHRARITADYKKEKVGFKVSLQDVRIWGETGQINKSDQLLSAHEAYGDYYLSDKSTFRIGRQEVIYDDHRFFGSLDWAMQGRSLDAFRYMYKNESTSFDVMFSWNQPGYGDGAPEPAKLVGNEYMVTTGGGENPRIFNLGLPKSQQMAYYKKSFSGGDIGIMLENDIYNSSSVANETYSNVTLGVSPNFSTDKLKFGGQFFYTGGTANKVDDGNGGATSIDLSGFMINAYVQATGVTGSPLLGIDYLSGDDQTSGDKVEGWSPKYGTNHKFYGFMDYFYVGNGHGGGNAMSAGLVDIYLKTAFKVGKAKVLAHLHQFMSAEERVNATSGESFDGALGTELDLVFVKKLAPELVFKAGYSQMFGITDTMKQLKFGNPDQEIQGMQSWGWVMLAFTPKFL